MTRLVVGGVSALLEAGGGGGRVVGGVWREGQPHHRHTEPEYKRVRNVQGCGYFFILALRETNKGNCAGFMWSYFNRIFFQYMNIRIKDVFLLFYTYIFYSSFTFYILLYCHVLAKFKHNFNSYCKVLVSNCWNWHSNYIHIIIVSNSPEVKDKVGSHTCKYWGHHL